MAVILPVFFYFAQSEKQVIKLISSQSRNFVSSDLTKSKNITFDHVLRQA